MFIFSPDKFNPTGANRSATFQRVDSAMKWISHYPLDTVKKPSERTYFFAVCKTCSCILG